MADPDDTPPCEPAPAMPSERRSEIRYPIGPERRAILIAHVDGDSHPVRVRNISVGGVSLILHRPYESGALLNVLLRNRNRNVVRHLRVRVLYALEYPNGDWVIGGSFARKLTGEELMALL